MHGFRWLLIATLLFSLPLTSACRSAPQAATEEKSAEPKEEGIHLSAEEVESSGIVTMEVVEGSVDETLSVQGRVIPRSGQQASVVAAFPGRLLVAGNSFPTIGAVVQQGQTLAIVEQELSATEAASLAEKRIDLEAQIQQAAQEVAQKTKDHERARALYEGGVIALKQLQLAESDLAIARAHQQAVIRARDAYDKLQGAASGNSRRLAVTAPISGTIITVTAAPNQQVDNSRPLFEYLWNRDTKGMVVDGVGYSFALSDKFDPRVGQTRQLLRIHPDGGTPGTQGCIGIVGNGDVQRRFREDMRAELAKNGGSFTLHVE